MRNLLVENSNKQKKLLCLNNTKQYSSTLQEVFKRSHYLKTY